MKLTKEFKNDRLVRISNTSEKSSLIYEKDQIVVFHHDDSDGKLGGHLVYEALALVDTKRFICCNYSTKMPDHSAVKYGDVVFIVDYCIPMEQLATILLRAKLVIFMDHHKTALNMVDSDFGYFEKLSNDKKIIIDIDMNRCGAKITSDWLLSNLSVSWNTEVVDLIDKYDRWTKEDIRGDYLNQFMYNSAQSYVSSEYWSKLLHDEEFFKSACEIGKRFYEFNIDKNELIYSSFAKEVEFHGLKLITIEGFGNSMLFGKHVTEYDACCVFHRANNGSWQYSLYSDKQGANMNEIAQMYGGGGHSGAAGMTVIDKLF